MKPLASFIVFSGIFSLLLSACSKEEPYQNENNYYCINAINVTGVIRDSLTGELITEGVARGYYGEHGYDDGPVDSTGHYSVTAQWNPCDPKYPSNKPPYIGIGFRKDANYHATSMVYFEGIANNSTVNHNFLALPYSHINVHIIGDAGSDHLALHELIGPGMETQHFDVGTGLIDTIISLKAYSNRTSEVRLLKSGTSYSLTPVTTGYGTTESIEIHYP